MRHPTVVPVSVTLLSGDRDGYLEPPRNWPQGVHWAHSWTAGKWQVEHGQRFDPLQNQSSVRHDGPTLIQSMHARLFAPFAAEVSEFMPSVRGSLGRSLRLLADCHPLDVSAAFWHRLLPRVTAGNESHAEKVAAWWRRCVDAWQREAHRDQVDVPAQFDFLGRFAASLLNPPQPDQAAALLADLCGPAASDRVLTGMSGLVLGHLDEPVATPGARRSSAIALVSQQSLPQCGVIAGETVGVSLVQPLGIPRQTAIPRCLHVVDNGVMNVLNHSTLQMNPGVTWQQKALSSVTPTCFLVQMKQLVQRQPMSDSRR